MKWKSGPRSLTHPMTHFFSRQRQMASHGTTRCHTVAWSAPQHSGAHLRAQRSSIQPVRSQDTASSYRPGYKSQDAEPGYRASTQPVQSQYRASTQLVQSQDTQPGYAGYSARIRSQYRASTGPVQSQYTARIHSQDTEPGYRRQDTQPGYRANHDTQPVHSQQAASTEPVRSQYTRKYRASTEPVRRIRSQYTTSRQAVHNQ